MTGARQQRHTSSKEAASFGRRLLHFGRYAVGLNHLPAIVRRSSKGWRGGIETHKGARGFALARLVGPESAGFSSRITSRKPALWRRHRICRQGFRAWHRCFRALARPGCPAGAGASLRCAYGGAAFMGRGRGFRSAHSSRGHSIGAKPWINCKCTFAVVVSG